MGDTTLAGRVLATLEKHPHLNGRTLRFEADAGRVTLKGVVSSFYQKQMAQEAVRKVQGVASVENQLEVNWPDVLAV